MIGPEKAEIREGVLRWVRSGGGIHSLQDIEGAQAFTILEMAEGGEEIVQVGVGTDQGNLVDQEGACGSIRNGKEPLIRAGKLTNVDLCQEGVAVR